MYRSGSGLRARTGRAFTLVELLVVVSIIALLIAILLPSLKKARQNAKRVHCNANLRSVAQAGMTYASDDRSELPIPVGKGDLELDKGYSAYIGFGGKSGGGVTNDPSVSPFGQFFSLNSLYRPLNFVLFKGGFGQPVAKQVGRGGTKLVYDGDLELDVYRCAGDKGFPGLHHAGWKESGLSGYDYYGTSYAANPYLIGPSSGGILESNSMYLRPLSRVPNPTNTVLYSEFAMRFAVFATNHEEYDQNGHCWPWQGVRDKGAAEGHHGIPWWFNVTFGDGHAAWVKIKGFGRQDGAKQAPSCTPQACVCLLQRGIGWQIDTMPAETIPTWKVRTAENGNATMVASMDGDPGASIWNIAAK